MKIISDSGATISKTKESRLSVAKECPHWSPVIPKFISDSYMEVLDCDCEDYVAVDGNYSRMVRDDPCDYFKTFSGYTYKNKIAQIFNLSKWEIETMIGRKRKYPIEVIDEGDLFLDNLTYKVTISSLFFSGLKKEGILDPDEIENLNIVHSEYLQNYNPYIGKIPDKILVFVESLSQVEDAQESQKLTNILGKLEIILAHKENTYVRIDKESIDIFIPRPDLALKTIKKNCGKIVLMSATFQSKQVLNEILGINPPIVEAETKYPGTLKIKKCGFETGITNSAWQLEKVRDRYYDALDIILKKATKPTLVQVHSYKYAPDGVEFNTKIHDGINWSTITDRGTDLPDDKCRSIVILKDPIPYLGDPILQTMKTKMEDGEFWSYINDMTDRELIQQVGRGLRHKDDWVEFWSPDARAMTRIGRVWRGKIKHE